jgi:hypothetical protein
MAGEPAMSYLHHYFGLLGCMLFMIAVPLTIIRQPQYSRKLVTVAIFGSMALAIMPVYDLVLAAYVRAGLGNLSITSMVMLCFMIASAYSGQQYLAAERKRQLDQCVIIGALIVYPTGLGLTLYDGYALGYNSWLLLLLLAACAGMYLWKQAFLIPALIMVAISAYLVNAMESDNLWDYLLDPWITLIASGHLVMRVIRLFRFRHSNG